MPALRKKRILVAPLNWGLGHASRCIPIIRSLTARGADVVLAADGRPYDFLKNEFPGLELHRLPDIDIRYSENSSMLLSMLLQGPHILSSFFRERTIIKKIIGELRIDGIISDNRFGLYTPAIPCIYMTHQIAIMTPPEFSWLEPVLRRAHAAVMRRYTECWIPDSAGDVNLSGRLSHGVPLPANAFFIGPLTRFTRTAETGTEYDVAAVLSGPEPQRSIFETILRTQLHGSGLRAIIVQGKPENGTASAVEDGVTIVPSMNANELNDLLLRSACVVSRSGYSSVMDIAALGKRAIFVPTPGQTEQEYVALRLRERDIFYSEDQNAFSLARALEQSRSFTGWTSDAHSDELLEERISHFFTAMHP